MLKSMYFALFASLLVAVQCLAAPKLSVAPERSLIDAPLRLVVDGLQPGQQFLIEESPGLIAKTPSFHRHGFVPMH